MARPGMGGGGSRSSGSHSSSRSSGGHRVGQSSGFSRPGTSYRSSSGSGSSFRSRSHYYGGSGYRHYGNNYYYGIPHVGIGGNSYGIVIVIMVVVLVLAMFFNMIGGSSGIPKSTVNREALENPVPFDNDCIVDELGFIENKAKLSKELQNSFYKKTGIQPYIVILDYQPELTTDAMKTKFAEDYYEMNIASQNGNEGTFLYMYFAESDPNEVGYMTYVNGKQVTSVMDEEAVSIFWAYVDRYWTDANLSGTELFAKVFEKTADTIMNKSTTMADVGKWIAIAVVVIGGGTVVILLVSKKHKRDKEKAAETERILNTPIGDLKNDDPLLDKYSQDKK